MFECDRVYIVAEVELIIGKSALNGSILDEARVVME